MAVYSMTGFGSATASAANVAGSANGSRSAEGSPAGDAGGVTVEARSVNSRFLDLAFRMPDELRQHEGALRDMLSQAFRRGKVELRVSTARGPSDEWPQPTA